MPKKPKVSLAEVISSASEALRQREIRNDPIPRFSQKHATIVDYLESKEFQEAKPAYQRRVLKQAQEYPHWTLAEARGHSKPTGSLWQVFDEHGKFSRMMEFKNRKEEAKYAEYLNAVGKSLDAGNDTELKNWTKKWGKTAKQFAMKDGTKIETVTDLKHLSRLSEFNELPSGADIYMKG